VQFSIRNIPNKSFISEKMLSFASLSARVAELVDALDSKSSDSNIVRVRFPLRAPGEGVSSSLFYFLSATYKTSNNLSGH
jgi:hypothetical protein